MEETKHKDIAGAIFLVAIGILFLLNTTNIVPWGIWLQIFRFWPILLILAGIRIVLPENKVGQVIYPIIYTLFILFIGITSYFFTVNKTVPFLPENVTNCIFNRCDAVDDSSLLIGEDKYVNATDYTNVTSRYLDISIAASSLTLEDDNADYFLRTQARYYTKVNEPTLKTELKDGILTTLFDNTRIHSYSFWNFKAPEYILTLGQNSIPSVLDIDLGAGEGFINLDSTKIKEIIAKVGAGSLELTLDDASIPETMNMNVGAGEITLTIPENVGILVSYNLGVGSIKIDDTEIDGIGKETNYKSSNYDTAEKKILITTSVGVGELTIDRK
jgi:hypothetical protein